MQGIRYATLLANWYSGATLLTLLLDRHPAIVSNGEAFYEHAKRQLTCSCGSDIRSCPFYRSAAEPMWAGSDFDSSLFLARPVYSSNTQIEKALVSPKWAGRARAVLIRSVPQYHRLSQRFALAHANFMIRACDAAKAELYLDGTKNLRRFELLLSEGIYPTGVILLVRDPRSWIVAWRKRRPKASLEKSITAWKQYIDDSRRLLRGWPSIPVNVIRMEDLQNNPGETLKSIFSFLGVAGDVDVLGESTHTAHVLGNSMRHGFDGRVRSNDRSWQDVLSDDDRNAIESRLAGYMTELGFHSIG